MNYSKYWVAFHNFSPWYVTLHARKLTLFIQQSLVLGSYDSLTQHFAWCRWCLFEGTPEQQISFSGLWRIGPQQEWFREALGRQDTYDNSVVLAYLYLQEWRHGCSDRKGKVSSLSLRFLTTIINVIVLPNFLHGKDFYLQQKPWIAIVILKLIRVRDVTYGKFLKLTNTPFKLGLFSEHKNQRNQLESQVRSSEASNNNSYLPSNLSNVKKSWDGIRSLINLSRWKKVITKKLIRGREAS